MYSEFSFIILKLALTSSLQFEGPLPEAVYSTHDTSRIEITQKNAGTRKVRYCSVAIPPVVYSEQQSKAVVGERS